MSSWFRADVDLDEVPSCCGVLVANDFQIESISDEYKKQWETRYPYGGLEGYKYQSEEDAWKAKFEEILQSDMEQASDWDDHQPWSFQRPIQFWFVKRQTQEKFDNEPLRQLVLNHKDQVYLGTFINPNTNNTVEGYMIKHNVKEVK